MIKSSEKTMEFCGKERHFKRCPNKALKNANKKAATVQKKVAKMQNDLQSKQREIQNLNKEADFIVENKDRTEKDIERATELLQLIPQKEDELNKLMDKFDKDLDKVENELMDAYYEKCELMLEPFTKADFDEMDDLDMAIVPFLEMFYDMYMSNFPEPKIEAKRKEIIEGGHKNRLSSQFQ